MGRTRAPPQANGLTASQNRRMRELAQSKLPCPLDCCNFNGQHQDKLDDHIAASSINRRFYCPTCGLMWCTFGAAGGHPCEPAGFHPGQHVNKARTREINMQQAQQLFRHRNPPQPAPFPAGLQQAALQQQPAMMSYAQQPPASFIWAATHLPGQPHTGPAQPSLPTVPPPMSSQQGFRADAQVPQHASEHFTEVNERLQTAKIHLGHLESLETNLRGPRIHIAAPTYTPVSNQPDGRIAPPLHDNHRIAPLSSYQHEDEPGNAMDGVDMTPDDARALLADVGADPVLWSDLPQPHGSDTPAVADNSLAGSETSNVAAPFQHQQISRSRRRSSFRR